MSQAEEAYVEALIVTGDDGSGKDRGKATDQSCGKRCYANKREVQTVRNLIMHRRNRRRFRPKALRYYHCELCAAWHLATLEQPKPMM